MSEYKVSYRYASSLLGSAKEKKIQEQVSADVRLIASALKESRQLSLALSNPVVKPGTKTAILEGIFKSKVNADTMNFLRFLVQKNRENLLESIADIYLKLRDEELGIVELEVSAAEQLTGDQEAQLKQKFESYLNKKVKITFRQDASVIGGFIARIGDTVYDASLKHQLELLKKQFLSGGATLN